MIRRTAEQDQLNELFHKAWGQAKGSSEYDKEVWRQLDMVVSPIVGASAFKAALTMTRSAAEKDRLGGLFHSAWIQAKGSPEYDKKVWRQLSMILSPIVGETAPETEQLALAAAARIDHALDRKGWGGWLIERITVHATLTAAAAMDDGDDWERAEKNAAEDFQFFGPTDEDDDIPSWADRIRSDARLSAAPTLAAAQAEWAAAGGDPERGPALSWSGNRVGFRHTAWSVAVVDGGVSRPRIVTRIKVGLAEFVQWDKDTEWCTDGRAPLADWRECVRLAEAADGGMQSP